MALIECPECQAEVSDEAPTCPQCGRPSDTTTEEKKSWTGAWQAVGKTKTPINVFALAMMACAAVFGASATQLGEYALPAFTYSLHTFLAVAGMFFVILLFCPKAIYHPDDLAKAKDHGVDLGQDRPILAAVLIAASLLAYGSYQAFFAHKQFEQMQENAKSASQAAKPLPNDN